MQTRGWLASTATGLVLAGTAAALSQEKTAPPAPAAAKAQAQSAAAARTARPKTKLNLAKWLQLPGAEKTTGSASKTKPEVRQTSASSAAKTPAPKKPALLDSLFGSKTPAPKKTSLLDSLFGSKKTSPQSSRKAAKPAVKPAAATAETPAPAKPGTVMDELEKLYARDGRPMPPMSLDDLPSQAPAQHSLHVAQAPQPAKRPNLLQRLFGSKKRAARPQHSAPQFARNRYPVHQHVTAEGESPATVPQSMREIPMDAFVADEAAPGPAEVPVPLPLESPDSSAPLPSDLAVTAPEPADEAEETSIQPASLEDATDDLAEHREKLERIAAREGSGFKGFCPVILRDDRELADASPEHASTWQLRSFEFSSAEAQAKFDAAPELYAPAAGGCDVVRLANEGEAIEGSLEFAVWYKDRLYLFADKETLRQFAADPAAFDQSAPATD